MYVIDFCEGASTFEFIGVVCLNFESGSPKFNLGIEPAHFSVDFWVLSEWRVGFLDWIVFGGFLGIPFGLPMYLFFIFMWVVLFLYIAFGLFLYMSFGLFRDFGYSLLWGVFILSRWRVDFALRHRDDALYRDAYHPFTV